MTPMPVRKRPPKRRAGATVAFTVAGCHGFVTVNEFDNGQPGELFLTAAKQGSTLAGLLDALAVTASLGLQHGVPLALLVKHLVGMRFEPAGRTDDPDLPVTTSLVDYAFRRLALDYLPVEERTGLGVLTAGEQARAQQAQELALLG